MIIKESKINETASKMMSAKEHGKDVENARYKFKKDNIEIQVLPWYGGPHPGFGINWSAVGVVNPDEARKFQSAIGSALKEVDRLNKKYKGCELDYDN